MTSNLLRHAFACAALILAGGLAPAQDEDEFDFVLIGETIDAQRARAARDVLEKRCVPCHNPEAEDRKAVKSWADALDVPTMIEEFIIEPDAAAQSYLLELVDDGEMPPPDSDVGAVTGTERAALLAWIEAGAPSLTVPVVRIQEVPPAGDPPAETAAPADAPPTPAADEDEPPRAFAWTDLGVLHPALVHFPVGLLLAAVLAELLVACGARGLRTASRFCAWLGFLGGLAAGAAGWLLAEETVDRLLEVHRWLGVATVGSALLLALSLEGRARGGGSRPLHVTLVVATAVLVALTAHRGGAMTWGTDLYSDLTFLPAFLR